MDEATKNAYKNFLKGPGGVDLFRRLVSTEAKYQMEGIKAQTLEGKGIAMTKIEATYAIRTMLDDLSKPTPS